MNANLSKPRLATRELVLLSIIGFSFASNFYTLVTVIPLYAIKVFQLSEAEAGLATGLFLAGMLSSRFISGNLVVRLGFRPMLLIGLTALIIFTLMYQVASTPISLYIVRFCNGFAYGLTSNTTITLVSTLIPRSRSGEGVGYFTMFQMLAWGLGPFIAIRLANAGNYSMIFMFCTILPIIALVLSFFLRIKGIQVGMVQDENTGTWIETKSEITAGPPPQSKLIDKFFERSAVPVAIVCLFALMFNSAVTAFVAVYADTLNLTEAASYFFMAFTAGLLVTRPFVSKIFDKKGATAVIMPGIIVYVASFLLLSFLNSEVMLFAAALCLGIGFGAIQNATLALTVTRAPRSRLGMANATYYMSLDLCATVGPIFAGLLIPIVDYHGLYMIAAIYTSLGLLVYYLLIGKSLKSSK